MRGELDSRALEDPVYRWGWKVLGWTTATVAVAGVAAAVYFLR